MIDEPKTAPDALPPPEQPPLLEAPADDGGAAGPAVMTWIETNQTTAMLGAFFIGVFAGVMLRS